MRTACVLLLVALACMLSGAQADTAVFETGDRLKGRLVELGQRHVVFRSEVAGRVRAPRRKLESLSAGGGAGSWMLVKADGEVYRGALLSVSAGQLVFQPEHGKRLRLRTTRVQRLSREAPARTDDPGTGRVYFTNGDRLSGQISALRDGKLTIKPAVGGPLKVDLSRVRTFSTSRQASVYTASGGSLRGRIRAAGAGRIRVDPGRMQGGRIMALSDITSVNQPPRNKPHWTGSVTGGYMASRGNTRTESSRLKLRLKRKWDDTRLNLRGAYSRVAQSSEGTGEEILTEQEINAQGQYDHFFTESAYSYGSLSYRRDRVANLQMRLVGSGGLGYQWVDMEKLAFSTEAGAGVNYEDYSTSSQRAGRGSAELSYDLEGALNDKLTLLHDSSISPNLGEVRDYYITSSAELRASLTEAIYSSFEVNLEYDAEPPEDTPETDTTYMVGGGVEF